jgi:hypothetical protein
MKKNEEINNYLETSRINTKIEGVQDDIIRLQKDLSNVVKGMETTRKYDAIVSDLVEKNRLMDQRMTHVEGIGTPSWYEMELSTIKDVVTNLQQELREEVGKWRKFREENYFQVVTYEEMLNTYKMSGISLGILSEMVHMELSGLSKWLNGQRKKDDPQLYHRIKQACLEYAAAQ